MNSLMQYLVVETNLLIETGSMWAEKLLDFVVDLPPFLLRQRLRSSSFLTLFFFRTFFLVCNHDVVIHTQQSTHIVGQ